MGIRAAAVAVIAVLLTLSSCSNDDDLIVGDSSDSDGEVGQASVSDEVRLHDLLGSVWVDPVAESATPTTAPLLSSTARAWNVQWVANSAFYGAVVEIGPVVSQGTDYGPGGTSDSPTWVESGSPMVFAARQFSRAAQEDSAARSFLAISIMLR